MGWVHQATNWWGNKRTITGCTDRNDLQMPISNGDWDDDETEPILVSENFQITGLIPFTQYQFDFFRTDDGAGAWYSSQFETTNILGIANPGIPDTYFDFAFKASKSGITFRDNSSNTPYTPKADTLACNTRSVKINYVWFNDTLGLNKYEWTWGDRKSNEQFPEIIFDKPGNYALNLKISFMNDSSNNFSQLIIVPQCEKLKPKTQINQTNNDLDIQVFPNPTDNVIYVHLKLKKQEIYKVKIMDSLGQITYNNNINGSSATIDCKSMASGLYYIQISEGSNNYFSKFIKL